MPGMNFDNEMNSTQYLNISKMSRAREILKSCNLRDYALTILLEICNAKHAITRKRLESLDNAIMRKTEKR